MDKYYELDKTISKEVMGKCKGQIVDSICPYCNGLKYYEVFNSDKSCTHIPCENCNGKGHYKIQY